MFSIGPYTFSDTDARRTVGNLDDIWALYAQDRDAAVLKPLYPTLTGDLGSDLQTVWAAWTSAGPALRAAGQLPDQVHGTVSQLSISDGGLPKTAVDSVAVNWRGVVGDRQATRVHHGRPWQALCLWSTEVIDAFHAEGHPVAPGLAGENITLTGIPWADVRAGVRLRVGEVLCEISAYALPCYQNKPWFKNGDFEVMHHDRGDVSRVYAIVLEPGSITVGQPAILEP
jgi:MOSC domain-containing protein YiiM